MPARAVAQMDVRFVVVSGQAALGEGWPTPDIAFPALLAPQALLDCSNAP